MMRAAIVLSTLALIATGCERTDAAETPTRPAAGAARAEAPAPVPEVAPDRAAAPDRADDDATRTAATGDSGDCGGGDCGGGGSCGGSCGGGGSCGEAGKACGCGAAMAEKVPRHVPPDAVWTTLDVRGMRCGGCAKKIEAALARVDGVYDVTADYTKGVVKVAGNQASVRDRVVPRIRALGYKVQ
jgi:copper chaperone CopZ